MQQPLVSVIVPCYNHDKYIGDCISSILKQTYHNIELIIIDDGSKDDSVEKIRAFDAQCKARFSNFEFRTRANKGLSATLNEALTWIKGEYFCLIASDDLMTPHRVATQIDFALKNPDVTSIYGSVQLINEQGELMQKKQLAYHAYSFNEIFLHQFCLYAPTQMHKTKDIMQIGGFNEQTKIEDWDILLRLANANKKIVCLPDMLASYRIHEYNTFSQNTMMLDQLLKIIELYKDHVLYNAAKYKIIKIYQLTPLKKSNHLKYLYLKLIYAIRNFLS